MLGRAAFVVSVAGQNVSQRFNPLLQNMTVSDKAGTSSDTASITLDDSGGRIAMPQIGEPLTIMLGWESRGVALVFDGTIDSVRSAGTRGGGRTLTITAKGYDPKGKAKEPLEFHKDDATLEEFMGEAAAKAGYSFQAQGAVGAIKRTYWAATTESFIAVGQRIARELGAQFKVFGTTAIMYEKNSGMSVSGLAMGSITALWGDNLKQWDISPVYARPRFAQARARYYDPKQAKWLEKLVEIPQQGPSSSAIHTHRQSRADEDEAQGAAGDNQRSSERERGDGSVTIVGNPAAKPEGTCVVAGTRPGIDGSYKIDGVEHNLSRGGGYETKLDLKRPEGDVGSDNRGSATALTGAGGGEAGIASIGNVA